MKRRRHGSCVVEFIGSSQAHWCFERGSPLPPALSLGGESSAVLSPILSASTRCSAGSGIPSPCGRGQGEGERDAADPNGKRENASRASLSICRLACGFISKGGCPGRRSRLHNEHA